MCWYHSIPSLHAIANFFFKEATACKPESHGSHPTSRAWDLSWRQWLLVSWKWQGGGLLIATVYTCRHRHTRRDKHGLGAIRENMLGTSIYSWHDSHFANSIQAAKLALCGLGTFGWFWKKGKGRKLWGLTHSMIACVITARKTRGKHKNLPQASCGWKTFFFLSFFLFF